MWILFANYALEIFLLKYIEVVDNTIMLIYRLELQLSNTLNVAFFRDPFDRLVSAYNYIEEDFDLKKQIDECLSDLKPRMHEYGYAVCA